MFYKSKGRPITKEDLLSFRQSGVITSPVVAYQVEGETIIQTTCPRIAGSRGMLQRIPDFVLPKEIEPWLTVTPTEATGETA
jgi:hypothetical protein